MREFLLLRHGKSDYPAGTDDFDRPLAQRGKADSLKIGRWLRAHGHPPDRIVTSPAERASSTALCIVAALDLDPADIVEADALYLATPDTILETLRTQPNSAKRVLFVGHNPGMEELTAALSRRPGPFPTAALAVFRVTGAWRDFTPAPVKTLAIIRPQDLS